jgi:hypothetical protein
LERKVGQQALLLDFFKKAFERQYWRDSIYREIRAMMRREGFSIKEACQITASLAKENRRNRETRTPYSGQIKSVIVATTKSVATSVARIRQ